MQSYFAQVCANDRVVHTVWKTGRMAQRDLVAAIRAHKRAQERLDEARRNLDEAVRDAVNSGEWQIVDVAEVTGWSRETVRKIAKSTANADT